MRDDINDARQGKAAPQAAYVAPPPAAAAPAPTAAPAAFPLPARQADKPTKTLNVPAVGRKRGKALKWLLITLFSLMILGGGAAAAWFLVVKDILPQDAPVPVVANATEILPGNYLMIGRYQLTTAADRTTLTNAWQTARGGAATPQTLLDGDPRLLLTDPELSEIYYVILEDSSDPFLVVPKTATTTQELVTNNAARFIEQNGWYIAHASTVEPYQAAVTEGTLAAAGAPALLSDTAVTVPLRLSLGAGMVPTLRTSLVSPDFLAGQLQALTLAIAVNAQSGALQLGGLADYFNPVAATPTNQELLSQVPAQATGVRLGASFRDDLASWLAVSSILDRNTLERPVVKQLLDQLSTPYALFTFPNAGTSKPALGLIIELPPSLVGKVTLQESALEQAVPALIPLILDRRTVAPVSFTEVPFGATRLRFANIVGTNLALDYAVTDRHILIASSKDSMQGLLNTVAGAAPPLAAIEPWQTLLAQWGAIPTAHDIFIGALNVPALLKILPTSPSNAAPFGVAISAKADAAASTQGTLSGVITTIPAPSTTPGQ